jgi:uncharacterized protein (DUF1778 family)
VNIDYDQAAKEMDDLKGSGQELEGTVRIKGRVSKDRRDVVTIRMRSDEHGAISRAANAMGQSFGEFVRSVSLERAQLVMKMDKANVTEEDVQRVLVAGMAERMENAAALLDQARRELTDRKTA